jgi:hypothetical protein
VLLLSGHSEPILARRGIVTTGLSLLEKPFSAAALSYRVREVLDTGSRATR